MKLKVILNKSENSKPIIWMKWDKHNQNTWMMLIIYKEQKINKLLILNLYKQMN